MKALSLKVLLGIAAFTITGGLVGASGILCAGGECVITGTWMGGSVMGAMLGLSIVPGLHQRPVESDAAPTE